MKRYLLGVLVIGLALAAEEKKPDDVKAKLNGTWKVVSMERDGKKAPDEQFKGMTLTFDGEKVTFKQGDDTRMATIKIDASQKPVHFDLIPADKDKKTKRMVFQLEDDTLKLGSDEKDESIRPKDFASASLVVTLKREKK